MTPKISFATVAIVGAALVFAVPAFGDAWGTDRNQETVRVSPDSVDRAAAVRQQELSSMLDARERSLRSEERGDDDRRRRIRFATIASGSTRQPSRLPPPRSTRPVRSTGCRSRSDSAPAPCSRSPSSWRCG